MSKKNLQVVIRDAGRGEPDSAGQHIYCAGCGQPVYNVAGYAVAQCNHCNHWNRIGSVLVRPAEKQKGTR